jgi:hypothetical protein
MNNVTHAVLNALYWNDRSSGRDIIEMSHLIKIIKEADPVGFNAFEPEYS